MHPNNDYFFCTIAHLFCCSSLRLTYLEVLVYIFVHSLKITTFPFACNSKPHAEQITGCSFVILYNLAVLCGINLIFTCSLLKEKFPKLYDIVCGKLNGSCRCVNLVLSHAQQYRSCSAVQFVSQASFHDHCFLHSIFIVGKLTVKLLSCVYDWMNNRGVTFKELF